MALGLQFIKNRSVQTLAAARELAPVWTWQERSPEAQQEALTDLIGDPGKKKVGQEALTLAAEQAMLAARGQWDAALDRLHLLTVQGVGMARTRFRGDTAKSAQLSGLETGSDSRRGNVAEASAWAAAWEQLEATWSPVKGNDLATFRSLLGECSGTLQETYARSRAAWRQAAEQLNAMAAELEKSNEAWYADATHVFAEGTPQGDMIRGTITTTYTRPGKEEEEPGSAGPVPVPAPEVGATATT